MCSIYTAEAFAIKTALEIIITKIYSIGEDRCKDIIIFSDCQAVLKAISRNYIGVYENKYILKIKELHEVITNHHRKKIIYIRIPVHVGITGNEIVLAKEGTKEEADNSIQVPIRDARVLWKKEA